MGTGPTLPYNELGSKLFPTLAGLGMAFTAQGCFHWSP